MWQQEAAIYVTLAALWMMLVLAMITVWRDWR